MKKLLTTILLLCCVGCTTGPDMYYAPAPILRKSAVLPYSKDKVWPALVAEVTSGFQVQAIEKESGLITTAPVSVDAGLYNRQMRNFCIPPKNFMYTFEGLRMSMQVLVNELEANKTKVEVKAQYEAYESNITGSWQPCESTGSIEDELLTKIENKVRL